MNTQNIIEHSNLNDRVDRLMLADLLTDEERNDEASLLRSNGLPLVLLLNGTVWWDQSKPITDEMVFFRAYLETILFSELTEDYTPLDKEYTLWDFSAEAIVRAWNDCMSFMDRAKDYLSETATATSSIAAYFWWTRNRHGVGFWSMRNEPYGDTLDKIAKEFPHCDVYVSDGCIYFA